MAGSVGGEVEPSASLGQFLEMQAKASGLSGREISAHFQVLADQEKLRVADGADASVDSVSKMAFSKSHLDRLFKGTASLPSNYFLRTFLEITSRAAGISIERHRELCRHAEKLLATARRHSRKRQVADATETSQAPVETVVAKLQVQLELERAQRTEDKLRWALSDVQILMGTLLQLIDALRDIIADLDATLAQGLRAAERSDLQKSREHQRRQAQSYRVTAETQFDRVNQRRRLLEVLWDQARANVQRLALHAEVTNIPSFPEGLAIPPPKLVSEDLSAQPALLDIAAALGKVEEHYNAEEQTALELQHAIAADSPLQPEDELTILVAATRLTDLGTRSTALHTLLKNWPQHSETRDVLTRLAHDGQSSIRLSVASSLAENWADDVAARDTLIFLAHDRDAEIRDVAVLGLVRRWAGDAAARDALVGLTRDTHATLREAGALGLTEGWVGDTVALEALVSLVRDDDVHVRMTVAEGLADGWIDDAIAYTALQTLAHDTSPTVRWAARQGDPNNNGLGIGSTPEAALLLAVRVRSESSKFKTIPMFEKLHRGISFDADVTVLVGRNGTGKTILLNALASSVPRLTTGLHSRNLSDWGRQLANELDLVWNEQREFKGAFHLSREDLDRRNHKSLSGAENWMRNFSAFVAEKRAENSLFLLDEPALRLDRKGLGFMVDRLDELVGKGCQIIIASVHEAWIDMPGAQVVRIDRRLNRNSLKAGEGPNSNKLGAS
ncbi:HEAT repeat domain-containing protein [Streptomyces microflavus]|uniref:HEAT repeat domain-containing protein n=1 Tax=Streptomyces microflavus TaxID=1919 RepID=UPI003450C9A9